MSNNLKKKQVLKDMNSAFNSYRESIFNMTKKKIAGKDLIRISNDRKKIKSVIREGENEM